MKAPGDIDELRAEIIARHERIYGRNQFVFDPKHYLALLEQNARIAAGVTPRRRRPARVGMRGSSQPATCWSRTSSRSLRFDRTTPKMVILPDEDKLQKEEAQLLPKVLAQLRARTERDFSRYNRSTILRRAS